MIEGTRYVPGLLPDAAPRAHLRETNFAYKQELLEQFKQRVGPDNLVCLIRYGSKVTGDVSSIQFFRQLFSLSLNDFRNFV